MSSPLMGEDEGEGDKRRRLVSVRRERNMSDYARLIRPTRFTDEEKRKAPGSS